MVSFAVQNFLFSYSPICFFFLLIPLPEVIFQRRYSKKLKTLIPKHIHTPIFIATLLTIAKIWPKCPSVDEQIKKLCYICIMEYYSGVKKKKRKEEILSFVTPWIHVKSIMLSAISQSEKDKYYMISLICRIE